MTIYRMIARTNDYNNLVATLHRQTETDQGVVKQGTGCASGPVTTTGMLTLLKGGLKERNTGKRVLQQRQYTTQYINDKKEI